MKEKDAKRNTAMRISKAVEDSKKRLKITKVVATRSLNTQKGNFFCGLSAACQDDGGGPGSDLELSSRDSETAISGKTLDEARIAQVILSLEATLGTLRAAIADEAISLNDFEKRVRDSKKNTLALLSRILPEEEAHKKLQAVE